MAKWQRKWRRGWLYVRSNTKKRKVTIKWRRATSFYQPIMWMVVVSNQSLHGSVCHILFNSPKWQIDSLVKLLRSMKIIWCFCSMAKISETCKDTHNRRFSLELGPQNILRSKDDCKHFFHGLFHNRVVCRIIGKKPGVYLIKRDFSVFLLKICSVLCVAFGKLLF